MSKKKIIVYQSRRRRPNYEKMDTDVVEESIDSLDSDADDEMLQNKTKEGNKMEEVKANLRFIGYSKLFTNLLN